VLGVVGSPFYHVLPFSPEMASAILAGRVDYVRATDPVTTRKAKATQGMSTATYYQSVVHATWVNNKKKPFGDPRVRRAMHLVLDKPVLVEVVKDVAPMMFGGFIYPFSEFATPKEELTKRLGYQSNPTAAIDEARALMAAAGHADGIKGLDYMVRDVAIFKLWSQAVQAMLKQTLNVECNLRTVVESVWFDDTANGHFDLAIGAIVSTLLDPSVLLQRLVWQGRPPELLVLGQRGVPGPDRSDRPGSGWWQALGADPPSRSHDGTRSSILAGSLGKHQRRMVQLR
jgi:peptide/nickel transport system substrate-binding protein